MPTDKNITKTKILKKQNDEHTRLICANLWQSFVFWIYPEHNDLIDKAEQEIKDLGGSSLKFKSGGYSKILKNIVGWKSMKKIKSWINI